MGKQDWSRRDAMMTLGIPVALAQSSRSIPCMEAAGARGQCQTQSTPAFLSVTDMGAVGDGRADDTRALQQTVDRLSAGGGGTMILPAGTFRTGTVHFPYTPAIVRVVGAGAGRSVWEMATPDQPIIAIDPSDPSKRSVGARFEDFSVRAHANGRVNNDAHVAIDCAGFSDAVFSNLRFLSNGSGSVGSLFQTAAHPHLSYHQRFSGIVCERGRGPGRVLRTINSGNELTNTNIITIDNFWIYANDAMIMAFDLSRATTYSIRSGLIESSGQDGIGLGNAGIVESIWIENLKGRPLVFEAGAGGTSSNNVLRDVYLSGFAGEIAIPGDCTNNVLTNVTGGNFRIVRKDRLGGNILINSGGPRGQPRISQFTGPSVRLREVQAYRASGLGERWNLLCELTPGQSGTIGLRIAPPGGSHLSSLHASALVLATGTPRPSATGWPIGDVFVTVDDTQPIALVVQLTLE